MFFCLMLLSKASCDAAAVAEVETEGMTLKRVLCIKPLLRAKDKAGPIPTKKKHLTFYQGIKLIVKVQTTRSENQPKGKSAVSRQTNVSLLQHRDVLFDVSVHMQK